MNNFIELNTNESLGTNGGTTLFIITACIAATAAAMNQCYKLGENIAEVVYYATH